MVALVCDGLVSDGALSQLVDSGHELLAVRLLVTTGSGCACAPTDGPVLVGVDPQDATLDGVERRALAALGDGVGIADHGAAELVGGTVALCGLDVRIVAAAALAAPGSPTLVAVSLGDLARSLAHTAAGHVPHMRSVVVVQTTVTTATSDSLDGWRVVASVGSAIPLAAGTGCTEHAVAA